ncbi:MAG TPA: Imm52 family immunity protein [Pirellulales bacterium]|nr:Imm52 family immunity protein [Pirellulales bacterium]
MIETYLIRAFWGDRRESLDECARRAEALFKRLAARDEVFHRWEMAGPTPISPYTEFKPTREALREKLDQGRNRERGGPAIENLGFSTVVPSGALGGQRVRVSVHCGAYPGLPGSAPTNSCLLYLPESGAIAERLLRAERLVAMIEAIVSSWDPDWDSFTSGAPSGLVGILPAEPLPLNMLGWVTYLSRRYGPLPTLPPEFETQDLREFGTLIVMRDVEHYTASDARQVGAIERLADTLHQAGVLRLTPASGA